MKKPRLPMLLLPLVLLAASAVRSQTDVSSPLIDLVDPQGDDHGAGDLVYPRDSAFARGDLDLRRLRAFAEAGGVRFEATFANPVRHPSSVRGTGAGSEDLALFARRGFYAFNLDLYLDTDRTPGSGVLATLPGRGARLHPAHAWDKAIVLTPRPELMRRQLVDALAEASPEAAGRSTADSEVSRSVHFVTDLRVRGHTVTFTVPRSFIDPSAVAGASLTALVTGAKLTIEAFGALTLGAQAPAAGRPEATMGFSGAKAPATAVVDLLAAEPAQQSEQLATGNAITGATGAGSRAPPPAAASGAAAPEAGSSRPAWLGQALDILTGFAPRPASAGAPAAATGAATSAATGAATRAATSAAAAIPPVAAPPAARGSELSPRRPRDAAFYEQQELRLRALQRLRDQGLITEEEYQRKRREILDAL